MKKKLRLVTAIGFMTVGGLLLGPASFAQVKIGTNPISIDANSNLEVEASTGGRKMSVNKVTGKVTIKDGTEGAGKVLTSDAEGGAEWKSADEQKVKYAFRARHRTLLTPQVTDTNFDYAGYDENMDREKERFNTGNAFSFNTGIFTAPKKGYYLFNAGVRIDIQGGTSPASHIVSAYIMHFRNGDKIDDRGIVGEALLPTGKFSYNVSTLFLLEENDKVFIRFLKKNGEPSYNVTAGFFEGIAVGAF